MNAMMEQVLPAPSTLLGAWVRERLHQEPIAWLTTVDAGGVAQPNPVWFLWDGESILIYNIATARRLVHIRQRPQVALHLDTYGVEGDAVVLIGFAEVAPDEPPADQQPTFMEKYRDRMDMAPKRWAQYFSCCHAHPSESLPRVPRSRARSAGRHLTRLRTNRPHERRRARPCVSQ